MTETYSHRRMAENEVIFRQRNEKIQQGFEELKKLAEEVGQDGYIIEDDMPLYFYCECSDEDCRDRVRLQPSTYNSIHENRSRFTIKSGHETNSIEKIVERNDDYDVVEKFELPPESAVRLNATTVDNS